MHQRAKNRWMKHLDFMILDILTVELVYLIVCHFQMKAHRWEFSPVYRSTQLLILLFAFLIVALIPMHKNILRRRIMREFTESLKYVSILVVCVMLYQYLMKQGTSFSRSIFLLFWVTSAIAVWLVRCLYKQLLCSILKQRNVLTRMILITERPHAAELYQELRRNGENVYSIDGILLYDAASRPEDEGMVPQGGADTGGTAASVPEVGSGTAVTAPETDREMPVPNPDDPLAGIPRQVAVEQYAALDDYIRLHPVDEVFLEISDRDAEAKIAEELLEQGIAVHIALRKLLQNLPHQEIEEIGGRTVVTSSLQSVSSLQLLVKRIMDIVGALIGLVFTGIAFVIFAPVIYRQSPGPIFYSQWRVGRGGRRFRIYKFRSMYPDADRRKAELMKQNQMKGWMFKIDNDPRIIPIGRFMRKYSIDELPQFFNVLKGEMSMVGTRPPTVEEWEKYSTHHRARLSVKPGLTGMWQVRGRGKTVNFEEVVRLDLQYIREWSLHLDLELLLETLRVVRKGMGR